MIVSDGPLKQLIVTADDFWRRCQNMRSGRRPSRWYPVILGLMVSGAAASAARAKAIPKLPSAIWCWWRKAGIARKHGAGPDGCPGIPHRHGARRNRHVLLPRCAPSYGPRSRGSPPSLPPASPSITSAHKHPIAPHHRGAAGRNGASYGVKGARGLEPQAGWPDRAAQIVQWWLTAPFAKGAPAFRRQDRGARPGVRLGLVRRDDGPAGGLDLTAGGFE